ncbi:meiotic chromosome segregation protein [Cucurbitaria berberidis CBS 394.84]|uniref:Meiotic chromosome segregation protein n=1 Tax=Cucurbitaria berberidis CBS 394.84 TaxID=1168544 RepID=A0A9P4GFS8_9PLEO|nr:meiotic chromosome segregation protein [Cucurbitaria berberidis CBS 394.84]KAF1844434.1 meiotic chromosome segregation protein [Cucurbitaria berberidis CBS 394.84]
MASRTDIPPAPAYFPTSADSPLHAPKELYEKLKNLKPDQLTKTQDFLIPPRSGKAWNVSKGQIWRLSTPEGPQVGDLNVWNAHDARERFWAARTRQLQGSHVKEGDRLWSVLPFMRPLCGMVADGCQVRDAPVGEKGEGERGEGKGREEMRDERGGITRWGGRCHDLLGTRCDPYVSNMLTGASYDYHCHSNLVRAILPHGLTEFDVHDVLNVFQVTGLDAQGRYFMESSPATKESFIDFFAEQDLLCALSTCPGGDLSAWGWHQADEEEAGGDKPDMKSTCRPIRVEVWELKDGVRESVLKGWKSPLPSQYKGVHGMRIPEGER